jgi:Predicted ester cyclase
MSNHPYSQLAREMYNRFGRNDFQGVLELVTDDIEATIIPFGQTFQGKEGFLQFMHGFKDAFPDMEIKIDNQVIGEDQVVNEISTTVTHTGPLETPTGVVPPTGKTVNFTVCEVWGIRDGKVASLRNYQDAASLMRQLGLM